MTLDERDSVAELTKYSDDTLREIIYKSAADYEEYMVTEAKAELYKRHEGLFSESSGDSVTLNKLIGDLSFDDIAKDLGKYIKKSSELSLYRETFEKLSKLKCKCDDKFILDVFWLDKKEDKLDTCGEMPPSDEKIDVTFLTWSEWLCMSIKKELILRYGREKIAAVSLIKMTANGFDGKGTERRLAEMEDNFKDESSQTRDDDPQVEDGDAQIGGSFLARGLLEYRKSQKKRNPKTNQIRPWVRFWARLVDYSCFGGIVYFLLRFIAPHTFAIYTSVRYISLSAIAWIFVEAVLLSTAGATLGKWLLRVSVRNDDGTKLKFHKSLLRSIFVWACGNGFMIVYIDFIIELFSYFYIKRKYRTLWDERLEISVSHKKIGAWRILLAAISLLFFPVLEIVLRSVR